MNLENLVALVNALKDNLTQIAAILGACVGLASMGISLVRSSRANAHLSRVEHRWNGRLSELLQTTHESAYHLGLSDGLRTSLSACPVIQQSVPPALSHAGPQEAA